MKVNFDAPALARLCRERGISRLEMFGSALGDDFRGDSDVDLLCTMRPDVRCGLFEWAALKFEFEHFFGRSVDLVSRWAIERSKNPYRRHAILSTAVPIYEEGKRLSERHSSRSEGSFRVESTPTAVLQEANKHGMLAA